MLALACIACRHNDPEPVEPQLVVNFTNTRGDWELVSWKGDSLPAGIRVSLSLKSADKTFVLEDNTDSMYPVIRTGSYNIFEEEGIGMILMGLYDYTHEYWNHQYVITSLTGTKMELTAFDDPSDVSVYKRVTE